MRKRNVWGSLTTMCAVAVAVSVLALPAYAGRFGGEFFGAFNTYSMGDWNDALNQSNEDDATDFSEINGSLGCGLNARMWLTGNWMMMGTWEPLFASTEDDVTNTELTLNGNSFQVTTAYFFPTAGKVKYGVGAGMGYYSLGGESKTEGFPDAEISGSTVGFHFMGMGEVPVTPNVSVTGSMGYRLAKIDDTEFDGESADPNFETEYSGMVMRVGVAFYMPTP